MDLKKFKKFSDVEDWRGFFHFLSNLTDQQLDEFFTKEVIDEIKASAASASRSEPEAPGQQDKECAEKECTGSGHQSDSSETSEPGSGGVEC